MTSIAATKPAEFAAQINARLALIVGDAIKDAGRTQREFGDAIGIPSTTFSRRLAATGQPFYLTELELIAAELGTNVSDLIVAAENCGIPSPRGTTA